MSNLFSIFLAALQLGLTSFGGPLAHIGYFHTEYVLRRKWVDAETFAADTALCQLLPGPASSQLGMAIGIRRGGVLGGVAAFLGFTLPSAILLIIFAYIVSRTTWLPTGILHGLNVVAVVIVAQAIFAMARKLLVGFHTYVVAAMTVVLSLWLPSAFTSLFVIVGAGFVYVVFGNKLKFELKPKSTTSSIPIRSVAFLFIFLLLIGTFIVVDFNSSSLLGLFSKCYVAGSLVFGGGHVVFPMLEQAFVATGAISQTDFIAGYGAAQAIPGPLFTFAGYVGAQIAGLWGALVALIAIFLPSFLLIAGILPVWTLLQANTKINAALIGINASVVGILFATFVHSIWPTAIVAWVDFVVALLLFVGMLKLKLPPWVIVLVGIGLYGFAM